MRVAVERVGLDDVAAHIVQQQVHLGQFHGVGVFLHAIAAEVHQIAVRCVVAVHIAGRLHKHTAGSAGWVEEFLVARNRLENFHHILHNRGGSVECAAALSFAQGKIAKEILVDLAEKVYADIFGDVFEHTDNFAKQFGLLFGNQLSINLFGQHTVHLGVLFLDSLHRCFHQNSLLSGVRCLVNGVIIGAFGQEESAFFHGHIFIRLLHTSTFVLGIFLIYFLLVLLEKNVCITQEDKPQDGLSVFVGCKVCAGTQHIGRVPEVVF